MTDKTNPIAETNASAALLPRIYRSDANTKFLHATVEQLTKRGSLTKLNGFIGHQHAKAVVNSDIFVKAADQTRQNYQLEPALTIENQQGDTVFFKDYQDYVNKIQVLGGDISNHPRLFKEEFYSIDPQINWDKFVNYQNYFWCRPSVKTINGHQTGVSTFTVRIDHTGETSYIITPDGTTQNPVIFLYEGQTYEFDVDCIGYPFSIKTKRSSGKFNLYNTGVTNNGIETGTLRFTVPSNAPANLFFQCQTDYDIGGVFIIKPASTTAILNIESELLGKKTFYLSNNTALSNGMLVSFTNASPSSYTTGSYFVEGIGTAIKLIDASLISTSPIKEYILMNRASVNRNPWSTANQWVHTSLLTSVQRKHAFRADRPIIEFDENLKLMNFGTISIPDVDLLDTVTTDAMNEVEGSQGYYIDGVMITAGQRVMFTADTNASIRNNIFNVVNKNGRFYLLIEDTPSDNQVVRIKSGVKYAKTQQWFNGTTWIATQSKTGTNVPPLFDVFDENGISFSDLSVYNSSSFTGSYVFSYKRSSGVADNVLGFPLTYKNINNIGDIVFNYDFITETFQISEGNVNKIIPVSSGYLKSFDYSGNIKLSNGWVSSITDKNQAAIRVFKDSGVQNRFNLDIYDDKANLNDLFLRVYVNGSRLQFNDDTGLSPWALIDSQRYKQIVILNSDRYATVTYADSATGELTINTTVNLFPGAGFVLAANFGSLIRNTVYYVSSITSNTSITVANIPNGEKLQLSDADGSVKFLYLADVGTNDVVSLRAFSKQPINANGFYEIPRGMQNNPLNETMESFTLGEVVNHVDSIVDNLDNMFTGVYPGRGNLRDLGNLSAYGSKFIRHSGPASIALYHLTSDTADTCRAIDKSRDDYNTFKRNFMRLASDRTNDRSSRDQVDSILQELTKNIPNTAAYFFTDMVPFGARVLSSYSVLYSAQQQYPLTNPILASSLSNQAIGVYVNDVQLVLNDGYTIVDSWAININASVKIGDSVTIVEYENTDGCFVPETPTKLGIWPKFTPKLYKDTTLVTPRWVIQGHDGSITLAYGDYDIVGTSDYRDELLLELEKRIYNNLKISYDHEIFNLSDIIPKYNTLTEYDLSEYNNILSPNFFSWAINNDIDYYSHVGYDVNNPFTYNFSETTLFDGTPSPGHWRGIYQWIYGTDRPHTCPWEMLEFTEKPVWWDTVYGPAPYTNSNIFMWDDIGLGLVREPNKPNHVVATAIRSYLINHIPVDSNGNLKNPIQTAVISSSSTVSTTNQFVFGDIGPGENAWRRSSFYAFGVIKTLVLMAPAKTLGILLDRSRIKLNLSNQLIYSDTGIHITPADVKIPSIYTSNTRIQTAGIINYIVNYIISDNLSSYDRYTYEMSNIAFKLSHRIGAFTSNAKFDLLLDTKSPLTTGSVFVPKDDYSIILNTSSVTKRITYSGVIITKISGGFSIRGYSKTQPYFNYYQWTQSGNLITVGGISESFVNWTPGQSYSQGQIVKANNSFYKATRFISNETNFDPYAYQLLASLPIVGGKSVFMRKAWDKTAILSTPYNTIFNTIQEVADFLLGYGEYLTDNGFVFTEFNQNLNQVANWQTSVKEFLFWTTQNWSTGQHTWDIWVENVPVAFDSIVKYQGEYYKAIRNIDAATTFDKSKYVKLDNLSMVGSSVISLSPGATKLSFTANLNVVDDIANLNNDYEILRVDGSPIPPVFLRSSRDGNLVSYSPVNDDGIYNASFYLVQIEHVVLINNNTVFNDLIYDPASGYKQDRIKVSGYVSADWYGGLDIPGFIYDDAKIYIWKPWTVYALGDIVQYQTFYYSANAFISGSETFQSTDWTRLAKKPATAFLPNLTNIATKFTDFYEVGTDGFDSAQQTMARHLIGYQKRQYLDNIMQDEVSEFKFFQGMIRDKGTNNVLDKLFSKTATDNHQSLSYHEEWAVRTGQYGAANAFTEVEITLDQQNFKYNPQGFALVERKSSDYSPYITQQSPNDLYLKTFEYNSTLVPTTKKSKGILNSAGYVRSNEVAAILASKSDILNKNVMDFSVGDYIWCPFESSSWNVFRYTDVKSVVSGIEYNHLQLIISLTTELSLTKNDYVGIVVSGIPLLATITKFYKVVSVTNDQIVVSVNTAIDIPTNITTAQWHSVKIFKLTPQRIANMDHINDVVYDKITNERVWTDKNGNGKWASWAFNPVFKGYPLDNHRPFLNLRYGSKIVADADTSTVVVTTATDKVYVYNKASNNTRRIAQIITSPNISIVGNASSGFGSAAAVSPDGTWLVIASPNASYVSMPLLYDVTLDSSLITFDSERLTFDRSSSNPTLEGRAVRRSRSKTPSLYTMDSDNLTFDSSLNTIDQHILGALNFDNDNTASFDLTIATFDNDFTLVPTFDNLAISFDNEFYTFDNQFWASNVAFSSENGIPSPFNQQGAVSLFKKGGNGIYYDIGTFVSPEPTNYEKFGANIVCNDTEMFIGAPGTGVVHRIVYAKTIRATTQYNPAGSIGNKIKVSNTYGISSGMLIEGSGFINNQEVLQVVDDTTVIVSALPDSAPHGALQFVTYDWQYDVSNLQIMYGSKMVATTTGNIVAVISDSAALIFKNKKLLQTINNVSNIAITESGNYVAVSDKANNSVKIYSLSTVYVLYQELVCRYPATNAGFGTNISFMNGHKTLVVHSVYTGSSTAQIDVYDNYYSKWVYSERLPLINNIENDAKAIGFCVAGNSILIGSPYFDDTHFTDAPAAKSGLVQEYVKENGKFSWTIEHTEIEKPDIYKIKKAFLYNKKTNALITHLDVVDPLQGKIPGAAEEEISYKTYYDPAIYSQGSLSSANIDAGAAWSTFQVGKLWWDLSTARFIENYDSEPLYRLNNWNTLVPFSSIDVYEWVESDIIPSAWDSLSGTDIGLATGISGKSLYADDVYSVKSYYDNISKTYKNTYYFWVKNKTTVPAVKGRYVSSDYVAKLIANPLSAGYTTLALTGAESFHLVNSSAYLSNSDVVLSVQTWLIDDDKQPVHSQWKLISDDVSTEIPQNIELKWFDSLCGSDLRGNSIPDMSLSPKLRYGIENRPLQSMFVNRLEALKQFVEQTNMTLAKHQISYNRNLSTLETIDTAPTLSSGIYDKSVDSHNDIQYVNTASYSKPILTPVVVDGRVISIDISLPGMGFLTAPTIEILGHGKGADAQVSIDKLGQITAVTMHDGGIGYTNNTVVVVRDFTVLVKNDSESNGKWALYIYNTESNTWNKTITKSYDTTEYWSYIDWYAASYNQFTAIDYSVNNFSDLLVSSTDANEVVKVRYGYNGVWVLLKRNNSQGTEWTELYDIIGVQNGTIQLSNTLYNSRAYDNTSFDSVGYDNSSVLSLRIILSAIKNDILIDDLKKDYLDLFFNSVRYAHSEQTYIDWAFKTSFIKVAHNVGDLRQSVTFHNDTLDDYSSFINEVKPYRTKVREMVSSYNTTETGSVNTSDFDLPAVYSNGTVDVIDPYVINGVIQSNNEKLKSYPWKSWNDNNGFKIVDISIIQGGSGYTVAPTVRFANNKGATAVATISNGKVTSITVSNGGKGFFSAPIISIDAPTSGVTATAVAILGNGLVRSNAVSVKFDRITKNFFIPKLSETETFIGDGNTVSFDLKWVCDRIKSNITITVNGDHVLNVGYDVAETDGWVNTTTTHYRKRHSIINFKTGYVPATNAVVKIVYNKDVSILNAADRINFFYNPGVNQLGKDLTQLMTGVDYGGVVVDGMSFDEAKGWNSKPFMNGRWNSYDHDFSDYFVTVTADEMHEFKLPYIPEVDTYINVYHNGQRIDDPYFNTAQQTNIFAIMKTPYIGAATTSNEVMIGSDKSATIRIPMTTDVQAYTTPLTTYNNSLSLGTQQGVALTSQEIVHTSSLTSYEVNVGDTFIFRQSTSDGSMKPFAEDYDVSYDGGNLTYSSATGYSPTDTIIDGDEFVSPTTSNAPEEVVPGQIVDALSIKVFEQPSTIAGNINIQKHVASGRASNFTLNSQLNSSESLFVTLETFDKGVSETSMLSLDTEYTLNYKTNKITLLSTPAKNSIISIFSIGINGTNIMDLGILVSDLRTTNPYLTKITADETLSSISSDGRTIKIDSPNVIHGAVITGTFVASVEVNGIQVPYQFDMKNDIIGFKLVNQAAVGSMINYAIIKIPTRVSTLIPVPPYVITTTEKIKASGTDIYPLKSYVLPTATAEINMIVRVDNKILPPSQYNYIDSNGPYIKFNHDIASSSTIEIFSSNKNEILTRNNDTSIYLTFDNGTFTLDNEMHSFDKISSITAAAETRAVTTTEPFIESAANPLQYYTKLAVYGGIVQLPASINNEKFLWVVQAGILLTPDIDYILNEDRSSITLTSNPKSNTSIDVITFNGNTSSLAFMQFKDMLNRNHYKDYSEKNKTFLVTNLSTFDDIIEVNDASLFDIPDPKRNKPGVIEIGSERIEYFKLNENKLSQLRRATLGTGSAMNYPAGTNVQNIGPSVTIPYNDKTIIKKITVTQAMVDSNTILLDFVPTRYSIPAVKIEKNKSYVIKTVGSTTDWNALAGTSNLIYTAGEKFKAVNNGVIGNGYVYPAWTYSSGFTSVIPGTFGQSNDIEVFIGGYDISPWAPNITYVAGTIINYGEYNYKCINTFISGNLFSDEVMLTASGTFKDPLSVLVMFTENIRLKKQPYKVFNVNNAQYSPEGDVQFDADFSVDGVSKSIRLTKAVPVGTTVTVIKQLGSTWDNKYTI